MAAYTGETPEPGPLLDHGTARRGAGLVPPNPAVKPFHRRSVVRDAEPKLVIGNAATAEQRWPRTPTPGTWCSCNC
ncbi:hypothetical protein ACH4TX_08445 [Streptomyces sp. NPDC021098]|uniref:hypothetical protein n=1 Tax=unclassified Streptomyces TaxID=2593676 RepID=UPI0037966EB9